MKECRKKMEGKMLFKGLILHSLLLLKILITVSLDPLKVTENIPSCNSKFTQPWKYWGRNSSSSASTTFSCLNVSSNIFFVTSLGQLQMHVYIYHSTKFDEYFRELDTTFLRSNVSICVSISESENFIDERQFTCSKVTTNFVGGKMKTMVSNFKLEDTHGYDSGGMVQYTICHHTESSRNCLITIPTRFYPTILESVQNMQDSSIGILYPSFASLNSGPVQIIIDVKGII